MSCPALLRGIIGACRFCIYIAGGASELCLKMVERYNSLNEHPERREQKDDDEKVYIAGDTA